MIVLQSGSSRLQAHRAARAEIVHVCTQVGAQSRTVQIKHARWEQRYVLLDEWTVPTLRLNLHSVFFYIIGRVFDKHNIYFISV